MLRRLAALDKECCAYFEFDIAISANEIIWNTSVVDDAIARQILDEYYELPVTATAPPEDVHQRFTDAGMIVVIEEHGTQRPANAAEIGIALAPAEVPAAADMTGALSERESGVEHRLGRVAVRRR